MHVFLTNGVNGLLLSCKRPNLSLHCRDYAVNNSIAYKTLSRPTKKKAFRQISCTTVIVHLIITKLQLRNYFMDLFSNLYERID